MYADDKIYGIWTKNGVVLAVQEFFPWTDMAKVATQVGADRCDLTEEFVS